MICPGPLSLQQRRQSQRNMNIFNLVNGLSYMCLGETVLILLAVRIESPDPVISTLGAMIYFGYLLLPLGRIATARVGAVRSQSIFWIARNIAALSAAAASVLFLAGYSRLAMTLLLVGAFFFYGLRAAGVVMVQPLIGNITTELERPGVIAANSGFFFTSCLISLIVISLLLKWSDSLFMLTAIIVCGALLGFTAAGILRRVDETSAIRDSARQPIGPDFRYALRNKSFHRLTASGFMVNLGVIMLIPISVLALKRGYGVSDMNAMLYSLLQFGASAAASFLSIRLTRRIGPRKTLLYAFSAFLGVGIMWMLAPPQISPVYICLLFLLAGGCFILMTNSVAHYFLQTVPEERRVSCSMLFAVVSGAGAGICGMILGGLLLKLCGRYFSDDPLEVYRKYFTFTVLLLSAGVFLIARLKPLPMEKRRIAKSWQDDIGQ